MTNRQSFGRERGVSLIEALVALAVMAFGMLGVVGMQTTLRGNADLSRQRAEAVRIAQEQLEALRNYSVLRASEAASGQLAFDAIASVASAPVAASDANVTFTLRTIVASPDPLVRQVQVRVGWTDRRAQEQLVVLNSLIAGVPPEVSALHALRTDLSPLRQPYRRHAAIPPSAVVTSGGTSSTFTPPGLPTQSWTFNNSTGLITQICTTPTSCVSTNRWLLSGIVAFATGTAAAPSASDAELPTDPVVALSISVQMAQPTTPAFETCPIEVLGSNRLAYYCAVRTTTLVVPGQRVWSGAVVFSGLTKASSVTDPTVTSYRICRYTPDDRNLTTLASIPASEPLSTYNSRNPYTFWRVNGPQQNKNFLVIAAGDGSTAFGCPDEDAATVIESNTWPHDPIN